MEARVRGTAAAWDYLRVPSVLLPVRVCWAGCWWLGLCEKLTVHRIWPCTAPQAGLCLQTQRALLAISGEMKGILRFRKGKGEEGSISPQV